MTEALPRIMVADEFLNDSNRTLLIAAKLFNSTYNILQIFILFSFLCKFIDFSVYLNILAIFGANFAICVCNKFCHSNCVTTQKAQH